jgi:hypothetical protein
MRPSTPREAVAPELSRLVEVSVVEKSDGVHSTCPRCVLEIFAFDRCGREAEFLQLSRFIGELRAVGYDVWCLEKHGRQRWWGVEQRWATLVHAPCAIAATVSSVVVLAFADPAHPYDLQRVFGSTSVPGLLKGMQRTAARIAFVLKRAAARLTPAATR